MTWIKRNLYFVIGSVVAVVLMALAVFYSLQKTAANAKAYEERKKDPKGKRSKGRRRGSPKNH